MGTRGWVILILVAGVVASFLFSSGFKNTLARRRSIQQLKAEIGAVSKEIEQVSVDIKILNNNPQAYDKLIRRELGYLKPGEKEIRFVDRK